MQWLIIFMCVHLRTWGNPLHPQLHIWQEEGAPTSILNPRRRKKNRRWFWTFEEECVKFIREVWLCFRLCCNEHLSASYKTEVGFITCQLHQGRKIIAQVSVTLFPFLWTTLDEVAKSGWYRHARFNVSLSVDSTEAQSCYNLCGWLYIRSVCNWEVAEIRVTTFFLRVDVVIRFHYRDWRLS